MLLTMQDSGRKKLLFDVIKLILKKGIQPTKRGYYTLINFLEKRTLLFLR